MKNKFITTFCTLLVWGLSSISLWLTVKFLDLTSTNQFTGKMKSFELELINSFKAMFIVMVSIMIVLKMVKTTKKYINN